MYEVLRQVCCESWGIAPWEFDAEADAGRVEFAAVAQAVRSRCASASPEALFAWLDPGGHAERKQATAAADARLARVQRIQRALAIAKQAGNAQAERELLAELGKINDGC